MEDREGGDISYQYMVERPVPNSPIKDFYNGSTIFITGATGFMGKILIEKLLRTCSELKKIYVLARAKKGKDIVKRFEEQFSDPLYEKLRTEQPNFMSKLSFITGDISHVNLGLNEDDYKTICNEVNVIFHMAATVRFDERLQAAVRINVRGTRDMFLLAKNTTQLRSFLYVSTAFSNCVINEIQEKFYDPPVSAENLINLVESLDEETIHKITPTLLGDFPNTYAYTKVAAENVAKELGEGLPVAVLRPSIIVGTSKEPVQGWIDNVYGPTGVVVGAGVGLLHSLHCDPETLADIIPVDYVINACLAIAYETARVRETPNKEKLLEIDNKDDAKSTDSDIPIYNFVSSTQKPIKWRDFMHYIEIYGLEVPTKHCIWAYSFSLHKTYFMHLLCAFFFHIIPAYIVDGICYCIAKKPQLIKAYEKIHKFSNVISYFCTQKWTFDTTNVQNLIKTQTEGDREIFDFDISKLRWEEYFYTYIRGVRVYLMKDPLDSLEEALKRYRLLVMAHYTLILLIGMGILRILWITFYGILDHKFIEV